MAQEREDVQEILEKAVLRELNEKGSIANSDEFLNSLGKLKQKEVFASILKSLEAQSYVVLKLSTQERAVLTAEAKTYAENGSLEFQILQAVPAGDAGLALSELKTAFPNVPPAGLSAAQGRAIKNEWVKIVDKVKLVRVADPSKVTDTTKQQLSDLSKLSDKDLKEFKKKQLIDFEKIQWYMISKGPQFSVERKKLATDITVEMLSNGSWKDLQFKDYNLNAKGPGLDMGALHPLLKVRAQFRSILLEMGFEEMPTSNYVESSFWNFDALFQPQQHPARDSHDTFFLKEPRLTKTIPKDYLLRVKEMHEKGGFGSIGYRYDWSEEESKKNILRTHTTAVSTRMLYQLAQEKPFTPKKYFSIDRVFRNEAIDATHLAEFHQVEGLVADRNLTLGDLIGVIQTFFSKIGISDVTFKPAYNPYTEPSMEIFGFSKDLNRWIEVGNSGVFRPEMLRPMGLPEDVTVIAWGLSLERPTMIKYSLDNIRELFGHKVDLKSVATNPIARYLD